MKHKILALIPARGGSKGIPGKNIMPIAGKPMIEYSIDAAKMSKLLNYIVVSTDSTEIAACARENEVEVIVRPSDIAGDESPIIDTINHAITILKEEKGFFPDIVVLLQPTSPLRNTNDIDCAIEQYLTGKFDSVISVCETEHSPYLCFTMFEEKLKPLFEKKISSSRRQDLPPTYRPNGAIYVSTPLLIKKYSGFISDNIGPYLMPVERSVDIDTSVDLLLAGLFFQKFQKKTE